MKRLSIFNTCMFRLHHLSRLQLFQLLGITLVVGGLVATFWLMRSSQDIRQQAEESVEEVKQKVMGATPKANDVKEAMKEIR